VLFLRLWAAIFVTQLNLLWDPPRATTNVFVWSIYNSTIKETGERASRSAPPLSQSDLLRTYPLYNLAANPANRSRSSQEKGSVQCQQLYNKQQQLGGIMRNSSPGTTQ
jgi:hypothetical protein